MLLPPFQNLAIDKAVVPFKASIIVKRCIPNKHKRYGIELYRLCNSTGHIYNMEVCWMEDQQIMAEHFAATHATVIELTRKVEGCGHKLYVDSLFFSPSLLNDLSEKEFTVVGLSDQTGRAWHWT
jgi:hypothetical protein